MLLHPPLPAAATLNLHCHALVHVLSRNTEEIVSRACCGFTRLTRHACLQQAQKCQHVPSGTLCCSNQRKQASSGHTVTYFVRLSTLLSQRQQQQQVRKPQEFAIARAINANHAIGRTLAAFVRPGTAELSPFTVSSLSATHGSNFVASQAASTAKESLATDVLPYLAIMTQTAAYRRQPLPVPRSVLPVLQRVCAFGGVAAATSKSERGAARLWESAVPQGTDLQRELAYHSSKVAQQLQQQPQQKQQHTSAAGTAAAAAEAEEDIITDFDD